MVQSYTRAEKIWQSSSVIINPQTKNGTGQPLEWIESVVDVIPGRDGPENLRILKRQVVEVRPLMRAVGFFGSEKQISLGLDRQRWVEILNTTRCAARWGGVSIVWLAEALKNCVSPRVTKNRTQKSINSFVPPVFVLLMLLLVSLCLYNSSTFLYTSV